MPEDLKYIINGSQLTAIGNSIRSKLDEETLYTVDEMPSKISSISGGGSVPETLYYIPPQTIQFAQASSEETLEVNTELLEEDNPYQFLVTMDGKENLVRQTEPGSYSIINGTTLSAQSIGGISFDDEETQQWFIDLNSAKVGDFLSISAVKSYAPTTTYACIPQQTVTITELTLLDVDLGAPWLTELPYILYLDITSGANMAECWGRYNGYSYDIYNQSTEDFLGRLEYMDADITAGWYLIGDLAGILSVGNTVSIHGTYKEWHDDTRRFVVNPQIAIFEQGEGEAAEAPPLATLLCDEVLSPNINAVVTVTIDGESYRCVKTSSTGMSEWANEREVQVDPEAIPMVMFLSENPFSSDGTPVLAGMYMDPSTGNFSSSITGLHEVSVTVDMPKTPYCIVECINKVTEDDTTVWDFFNTYDDVSSIKSPYIYADMNGFDDIVSGNTNNYVVYPGLIVGVDDVIWPIPTNKKLVLTCLPIIDNGNYWPLIGFVKPEGNINCMPLHNVYLKDDANAGYSAIHLLDPTQNGRVQIIATMPK